MKQSIAPLFVADEGHIDPTLQLREQLMIQRIIKDCLVVVSLVLLWFLSDALLASSALAGEHSTEHTSDHLENPGFMWMQLPGSSEKISADALSTSIHMTVSGPILRATVRQTFRNDTAFWLEGVYSFPLPEQAAVDQLRMQVGDRLIQGEIHEKQTARILYQQAKEAGHRASLLKQHRTNIFTTEVANIEPNDEIIVEFEYQQVLDFRAHQYTLRFPMVSTPPYTPERTRQTPGFIAPANSYRASGDAPGNPVEISVDLNPGFPIELPSSISHPIKVTAKGKDQYQIHLNGAAALSNRDFILSWKLKPSDKPLVNILREDLGGESYGLMMVMPPQALPGEVYTQARELIWVLDVSGSMQGESIEQARSAMLKALSRLEADDYFNIIFFNTAAWSLFPHPRAASPDNLNLAREKILRLEADGGTDMLPALKRALDISTHSERLRQVIFVTDGAVSNETELFSEIQHRLAESRLFTVGIGSAPNSYFMRKAALAGRGSFTYISQPQEVSRKIDQLMRTLETPALTDLGFDINDPLASVLPATLPDLYLQEPLYIAFKSSHFPGYAELRGTLNGMPSSMRVPLQSSSQHKGVAVEWARRKLDELVERYQQTSGEQKTSIREQALRIALAHHQVSQFTSLVAIDQAPVRSSGELNTLNIPANLPKGWVSQPPSSGQGIRLAKTATDNRFHLWMGLLWLALAVVLKLIANNLSRPVSCA